MMNQTLIAEYEAAAAKSANDATAESYRAAAARLRGMRESVAEGDIAEQVLTTAQLLVLLETTEEGQKAMRASLEAYFPYIGTNEQFRGSECVDRLNEWWGNLGGEFDADDDEEKEAADAADQDKASSEALTEESAS